MERTQSQGVVGHCTSMMLGEYCPILLAIGCTEAPTEWFGWLGSIRLSIVEYCMVLFIVEYCPRGLYSLMLLLSGLIGCYLTICALGAL